MYEDRDYGSMVDELLAYDGESGNKALNSWEIRFLDSIYPYAKVCLTDKQQKKVAQIWNAIFGG